MKAKLISLFVLLPFFLFSQVEIRKASSKDSFVFMEIAPDTVDVVILTDQAPVQGKMVSHQLKCVHGKQYEGMLFTSKTEFLDKSGNQIKGVLAWALIEVDIIEYGDIWHYTPNDWLKIPRN